MIRSHQGRVHEVRAQLLKHAAHEREVSEGGQNDRSAKPSDEGNQTVEGVSTLGITAEE